MNQAHVQRSTKQAYWKEHLQQYEASGMCKAAYCREHNLNYDQFKWWYRKLRDEKKDNSSPFVAIAPTVTPTTHAKKEYPVKISIGGMEVQVNEGVSKDTVATIIAVLQEAVCR